MLVLVVLVPYFLIIAIPRLIKEIDRIPISAKEDYITAYFIALGIILLLLLMLDLFYARYRENLNQLYDEEGRNTDEVNQEWGIFQNNEKEAKEFGFNITILHPNNMEYYYLCSPSDSDMEMDNVSNAVSWIDNY